MIKIMDLVDAIVCAFGNLFDRPIKPNTVYIHPDVMRGMMGDHFKLVSDMDNTIATEKCN